MKKKKLSLILGAIFIMSLGLFTACGNKTNNSTTQNVNNSTNKTTNESEKDSIKDESTISTEDLLSIIDDNNVVIVDVRSEAGYLGWKLGDEKQGGHIKGAVDFPISWIELYKNNELEDVLTQKGIVKEKNIVVYDENGEDSIKMAETLEKLGYENIQVYEGGIVEWASDSSRPMDKLNKYDKLVHAEWLNDLINDKNPENYSGNEYKIFEVSWGDGKDYTEGHIPGAIHLDTNSIEEEPFWNIKSDEDLLKMLLANGIKNDTTVILYGGDTTAAARAASVLMYCGVEDVRLLNGGFGAWKSAGFEIETGNNEAIAVEEFGADVPVHPEYIVGIEDAKRILADENAELVSIRSWPEFIGETSGYSYIEPKGRIKGAAWGHAGSNAYHMEHFRNIDNTMINYNEIKKMWAEWGITSDKEASFYCGTGWRASETFFYAYLMGWENISVFDGGWYEWSADESNPTEVGELQK